jgi:hypothetical protein
LAAQGICLEHYLAAAFDRLSAALQLCHDGRPVDPGAVDWLLSQGEFAAQTLAHGEGASDPLERTRLLELLLCLANLHEYVQHHSIEPPRSARPARSARAS